jgi:short subunit dehydrogenase-like uncharacterized protein
MNDNAFLLYGANGYTGELIARYAAGYNLSPILAGRREDAIRPLAEKLKLPWQVIDLDDTASLENALKKVTLVLHAAGPFQFTAKQMIEACLKTGTHYTDINGDISVFEMIKRYSKAASEKGIMLMPGAGFDVVPTDCLALYLKNKLPDADKLKIAFASIGGALSHGTAMTMASKAGEGGAERKDGKIVRVPMGKKTMWVEVNGKKFFVMSIPWGDVSTAYFTTQIPNIETYTGISPKTHRMLKFQFLFNWLLRTKIARNYLKRKIKGKPAGPSDEKREKAIGYVWSQVTNPQGKTVTGTLTGPEGYTITVHTALIIAKKILAGNFKTGYQTPAAVYGADLILEAPGMVRELLS